MSQTELNSSKIEVKGQEEKTLVMSDEEKLARLKELGLKPPGFLRDMMDKDLKDVDSAFME